MSGIIVKMNERSKSKGLEAKDAAQKLLMEFCESTSLHGYSYLYNANSMCLRVMWIFVILLMTYLGISFVLKNTNDYMNSRILTSIETSSGSLNVSMYHLKSSKLALSLNTMRLTLSKLGICKSKIVRHITVLRFAHFQFILL